MKYLDTFEAWAWAIARLLGFVLGGYVFFDQREHLALLTGVTCISLMGPFVVRGATSVLLAWRGEK